MPRSVVGAQSKLYLAAASLAPRPRARGPSFTAHDDADRDHPRRVPPRSVDVWEEGRWVAGDTIGHIRTQSFGEIDLAPVPVPSPAGPRQTVPHRVEVGGCQVA